MINYKIVVLDVDGTLITSDKQVTQKTIEAIELIKSKGLLFAIATGRPVRSILTMVQSFKIDHLLDFIICSNGVETYDMHTKERKKTYPLSKTSVVEIGEIMKRFQIDYCLYEHDIVYASSNNEIVQQIAKRNFMRPIIMPMEALPIHETNKVVFTVDESMYDTIYEFQQNFTHEKYHCFFTQPDLFEFVDKRVTKAEGIKAYIENKDISIEEVIAFGDAQNDIEMLSQSGLGVAMGNADDSIKAVAKDTTLSNDEDGIADYLFKLFDPFYNQD